MINDLRLKISNQIGFINVFALLLLVGGIVAGVYLVQQRTNLLPKAQEKTVACDGQTLASQSEQSQNDFKAKYGERAQAAWVEEHEAELAKIGKPCPGITSQTTTQTQTSTSQDGQSCRDNPSGATRPAGYKWVADCAKSCTDFTNHTECPKNSSDPQNVNPETSRWCYGFKEGGRCLKLEASAGDPGLSAQKAAQNISQASQTQACTNGSKTYYDSKVATRLALYYAILQGVSEACVKADLGLDPQLTAQNEAGITGRLFLCSGKESKPGSLILKWRVDTGTAGILEQVKNPPSTDPNNLPNKDHVKKAEELLKVTAPNISTAATDQSNPPSTTTQSCEDSQRVFAGCAPGCKGEEWWTCPAPNEKDVKTVTNSDPNSDCNKACAQQ